MGQALYRTHRPKRLTDVVGQEHITITLQQALKQGRISHAYLFTGPRGVGKTSVARILAHELNELPYEDDSSHIDIIEIDAASNRRIDEIRDLREKVYVAPTTARYKVYIIDEVHMLTREAFNALLKTLEEPPAHVVFILATTDAHKLPETIISRTQRFSFKPVPREQVVTHLAEIAKQENIKVSRDALELLAEHGEGSFRDSISLLDQAGAAGRSVELADVRTLLGIPPAEAIEALLQSVSKAAPTATIMKQLSDLLGQGFQASAIASQLAARLRSMLANETAELPQTIILDLLARLIEVPAAYDPERSLEVSLLYYGSLEATPKKTTPSTVPRQPDLQPDLSDRSTEVEAKDTDKESDAKDVQTKPLSLSVWPELLQSLKRQHNTLYGVVRMAEPVFSSDSVQLKFAFPFHKKRVSEAANRRVIVDTIAELTGRTVNVECIVDKNAQPPKAASSPKEPPAQSLSAISNIFGGGELLES